MNHVLQFVGSAAPYVIMAVCVAILVANHKKWKENTYMSVGMCIGTGMGSAVATLFHMNLALGVSLGMLVGETVGLFIPMVAEAEESEAVAGDGSVAGDGEAARKQES